MDDVTFFGPSVPQEVRRMIPLFEKIDQTQFRKAAQCAVEHLNGNPKTAQQFSKLSQTTGLSVENFGVLFTGLYLTIRAALRAKTKIDQLDNTLTELHFPDAFRADLLKILQPPTRTTIETASFNNGIKLPQFVKLTWRIDVTISTSAMLRVMKPSILVQLTRSDGQIRTFEMTIEKFHDFRFQVAKVLKAIEDIEKSPILKIEA